HVGVVDPGVGSDRRPILADTGREILIGPDNGLLSWAWRTQPDIRVRVLSNEAYRLSQARVTFDGRDLFAPAAAHLASGVDPALFGPKIDRPLILDWPDPVRTEGRIEGRVLVEDAFGNLITNIPFEDVAMEFTEAALEIELNGRDVGELCGSYEAITGVTGVVVNGTGLLEIAANRRSAAEATGARRGARVVVRKRRVKP
ncbi:MAG TPA: SAM-dependent chlorinase/fluorinase, partial [Acidobacteriota bacterium]|nr:SAM-dependent chlorinase/fluorinase [Acidobacteriota bacterium]